MDRSWFASVLKIAVMSTVSVMVLALLTPIAQAHHPNRSDWPGGPAGRVILGNGFSPAAAGDGWGGIVAVWHGPVEPGAGTNQMVAQHISRFGGVQWGAGGMIVSEIDDGLVSNPTIYNSRDNPLSPEYGLELPPEVDMAWNQSHLFGDLYFPGGPDGIDNDCDGGVDEDLFDGLDNDGDGHVDEEEYPFAKHNVWGQAIGTEGVLDGLFHYEAPAVYHDMVLGCSGSADLIIGMPGRPWSQGPPMKTDPAPSYIVSDIDYVQRVSNYPGLDFGGQVRAALMVRDPFPLGGEYATYMEWASGMGWPTYPYEIVLSPIGLDVLLRYPIVPDFANGSYVIFSTPTPPAPSVDLINYVPAGRPGDPAVAATWGLGIPISTVASNKSHIDAVPDGAGGAIVVWDDDRAGNWDIYAQRINSLALYLWDPAGTGIPVAAGLDEQSLQHPVITPAAGAGTAPEEVFETEQSVRAVTDGAGGVIIVWVQWVAGTLGPADVWATRLDEDGAVVWGPTLVYDDMPAGFDENFMDVVSDGRGGAIVAISVSEPAGSPVNTAIVAQRLGPAGELLWGPAPVPVAPAAGPGGQTAPRVVSDRRGGAIVMWQDFDGAFAPIDLAARRIYSNGVFVDDQPPTPPQLVAFVPTPGAVELNWTLSSDNDAVYEYGVVHRQGPDPFRYEATTTASSFTQTGLGAGTYHHYFVTAADESGNHSISRDVELDPSSPGTVFAGLTPMASPLPGLSLTFTTVTVGGPVTATTGSLGATPPSGFSLLGTQYDIDTGASYDGTITVAIKYDETLVVGDEADLDLFHYKSGEWKKVTKYLDVENNVIVGEVSELSWFGIGVPEASFGGPATGVNESFLVLLALLMMATGSLLPYRVLLLRNRNGRQPPRAA